MSIAHVWYFLYHVWSMLIIAFIMIPSKTTVICLFSISAFGQVEAEAVARLQTQDEDSEAIFDITHLSISMWCCPNKFCQVTILVDTIQYCYLRYGLLLQNPATMMVVNRWIILMWLWWWWQFILYGSINFKWEENPVPDMM